MIYVGNGEISGIYLGNSEISGIYIGDNQIYPMNFEGIKLSPTSIVSKKTGGTQNLRVVCDREWTLSNNESWITISQSAGTGNALVTVTFSENNTGSARTDTISAITTDNLYSATTSVEQITCQEIPLIDKIGTANNQGFVKEGIYMMDSGLTEINSCDFDFSGIKCICSRTDGFYTTPCVSLGQPWDNKGCLNTLECFDVDCTGIEVLAFVFGVDRASQTSQSITSATFTNTDSVTTLRKPFLDCQNLETLNLGSLANVTTVMESNVFSGCIKLTNLSIDAWPKMNIGWGLDTCTALTETSIINVLNALPSNANNTLIIGSTNKNKLTSAEGIAALAAAQNKGWTVN